MSLVVCLSVPFDCVLVARARIILDELVIVRTSFSEPRKFNPVRFTTPSPCSPRNVNLARIKLSNPRT
jgi:hypothetical protein